MQVRSCKNVLLLLKLKPTDCLISNLLIPEILESITVTDVHPISFQFPIQLFHSYLLEKGKLTGALISIWMFWLNSLMWDSVWAIAAKETNIFEAYFVNARCDQGHQNGNKNQLFVLIFGQSSPCSCRSTMPHRAHLTDKAYYYHN